MANKGNKVSGKTVGKQRDTNGACSWLCARPPAWYLASVLIVLGAFPANAFAARTSLPSPQRSAVPAACLGGDDYNATSEADVIVAGLVQAWQVFGRPQLPGSLVAIRLTLAIDRIFKGRMAGTASVIDTTSLLQDPHGQQFWLGGRETCGAFDDDPTGAYVIIGLTRWRDGTYRTELRRTFFVGAGSRGAEYQQALNRLTALNPHQLPDTAAPAFEACRMVAISVLLLAGGYTVRSRSRWMPPRSRR